MQTTNIAEQIINGSRNIDLMKKQAEQLVRMIIGLVRYDRSSKTLSQGPKHEIVTKDCVWEVGTVSNSVFGADYEVTCFVKHDIVFSVTSGGPTYHRTELTQTMHENLSDFVEGMKDMFPTLRDKLHPFIMAAEAL